MIGNKLSSHLFSYLILLTVITLSLNFFDSKKLVWDLTKNVSIMKTNLKIGFSSIRLSEKFDRFSYMRHYLQNFVRKHKNLN